MLLLRKFKVLGHSMEPTIGNGKFVLVSRMPYLFSKPKVKDVVAFKNGKEVLIKRIVKISSDKYTVEGDNPNDSLDSRNFGSVIKNDILGKVVYKF